MHNRNVDSSISISNTNLVFLSNFNWKSINTCSHQLMDWRKKKQEPYHIQYTLYKKARNPTTLFWVNIMRNVMVIKLPFLTCDWTATELYFPSNALILVSFPFCPLLISLKLQTVTWEQRSLTDSCSRQLGRRKTVSLKSHFASNNNSKKKQTIVI